MQSVRPDNAIDPWLEREAVLLLGPCRCRPFRPALARIWDGPETLPTADEITEPGHWIARVLDVKIPA